MDNKWLWIGFGALVFVFVFARSRAGAQVIAPAAPDTTATDQARYGFAASGFQSLTDLLLGRYQSERDIALGQYSYLRDTGVADEARRASQSRDDVYLRSAIAAADAEKYAANKAATGRRGGGVNIGPFHLDLHW